MQDIRYQRKCLGANRNGAATIKFKNHATQQQHGVLNGGVLVFMVGISAPTKEIYAMVVWSHGLERSDRLTISTISDLILGFRFSFIRKFHILCFAKAPASPIVDSLQG